MRWKIIGFLAGFILLADQLSKYLVEKNIAFYKSIYINSFFNLVHVRNKGAAFGFLNDPSINWQLWFFLFTTLIALLIIFYLALKAASEERWLFISLGFVSGGALGNAVDRIRLGEVIDFLDLHYAGWHWPAFNIADIAICLGAAIMLLFFFKSQNKNKETS